MGGTLPSPPDRTASPIHRARHCPAMCDVTNPVADRYRWAQSRDGSYRYVERVPQLPRVDDTLLDSVVYIYPSEEDAQKGAAGGGTGFLVGYPVAQRNDLVHVYLVTNSHVATHTRTVAVRINLHSGGTKVITLGPPQWFHHPDNDDVAVAPISLDATYRFGLVPVEMFATKENVEAGDFGAGDECFCIGRHINLDGKLANTPAARFGNVAIMRPDPVHQGSRRPHLQESIAVEARSLGGFSGAPVFVWSSGMITTPKALPRFTPNSDLTKRFIAVVSGLIQSPFALLGITWGHMNGRTS
jgi:hypothetical protein